MGSNPMLGTLLEKCQGERGPVVEHLLYTTRVLGSNPALGTLRIVSEKPVSLANPSHVRKFGESVGI